MDPGPIKEVLRMFRSMLLERHLGESLAGASLSKMLIQLAPDFLLDHAFERGKQHAELGSHMDVGAADRDLAFYAGTLERQRAALPLALDIEFLAHARGDFIDQGVSIGLGKAMRSVDIDARHRHARRVGRA